MRLPMEALADAQAMVSQGCKPIAVSSDSEGEWVGVAMSTSVSHHSCGQQMPEFHCNAPEHASLYEMGDAVSLGVTRDAAESTAGTTG